MPLAYHFVADKLRDGRPIPADGEWLVHDGEPIICQSGLHASWHPFDALQFAPGGTLCLVEVEEITDEQPEKLVCKRRKIVQRIDAEPILREFARWCALQVVHLWDAPEVVVQYLKTGDESLRDAARAAARDVARGVAWAAALAAARAAARDVAWGAARGAAWDAAWDAARGAAWDAAWDAAGDAAWDAARADQRSEFKKIVDGAFEAQAIRAKAGEP